MSFEKEFPSLTKEEYSEEKGRWYEEQQIQNTCLDKQRVKEVILNNVRPDIWHRDVIVSTLFKELGLEDEEI